MYIFSIYTYPNLSSRYLFFLLSLSLLLSIPTIYLSYIYLLMDLFIATPSSIYISIYDLTSNYVSIYPICLLIHMSTHICVSIPSSIYISMYSFTYNYVYIYLFIFISIFLYLFILFLFLSIYVRVFLCVIKLAYT